MVFLCSQRLPLSLVILPQLPTSPQAGRNFFSRHLTFLFFSFFIVFHNKDSLCSSGCSGTHSVDQGGLESKICLTLPLNAGIKGCAKTAWHLTLKACFNAMPSALKSIEEWEQICMILEFICTCKALDSILSTENAINLKICLHT